ncbi:hypothetical protein B0T21DRAFT_129637 [Apiosordaria backusii]|uniref:Transmembrane protein n=1 Tax=Apiosordaria backusii TaxID=314023 RepID=A0AA40K1H1_9PEZI|nr:hypothetical protein B0T21DRAFT_129637 [Apiosordaria backusii]
MDIPSAVGFLFVLVLVIGSGYGQLGMERENRGKKARFPGFGIIHFIIGSFSSLLHFLLSQDYPTITFHFVSHSSSSTSSTSSIKKLNITPFSPHQPTASRDHEIPNSRNDRRK